MKKTLKSIKTLLAVGLCVTAFFSLVPLMMNPLMKI